MSDAYPTFCKTDSDRAAFDVARAGGWSEWVIGLQDIHAIREGCYFDIRHAERVRQFFHKFLRHSTGKWKGQPFTLLEWQWRDVIAPLYGWRRADGRRRFTRGYLSCAKKNGKTGLIAGLVLYHGLADGEAGGEVYTAAGDLKQASIIFREARKMVNANPALKSICRVTPSSKLIEFPDESFMNSLSAEVGTKEGLNASAVFFDELHSQPDRFLWEVLRYATSARDQPLMLAITTAGTDLETICGEQYEYAHRVLLGEFEDTAFYAKIYEVDINADWKDEREWYKANPSLGVTISIETFRADFREALEAPAKEPNFRRYRLNQWVEDADAWLSMEQWANGASDIDAKSLLGRDTWAGLDLSATDDTTALIMLCPKLDGLGFDVIPHFWLPADNAEYLERKHKVPYRAWAKQGFITLTTGNVVDYPTVRAKCNEISQQYNLKKITIDRKFQGQALENNLIEDGLEVMPMGAGWVSQDLPAKELEKLLKAAQLSHDANPVLKWHASNAVVDVDKNGNYSLNKRKSRSKIDGIAGLVMAIFGYMSDHKGEAPPPAAEFFTLT